MLKNQQAKTHIFAGFMEKQPYSLTFVLLIISWISLLMVTLYLTRIKPWLDKHYGLCKVTHITVVLCLMEVKLIFEFLNTYGILNGYLGKLSKDKELTAWFMVTFLDKLG